MESDARHFHGELPAILGKLTAVKRGNSGCDSYHSLARSSKDLFETTFHHDSTERPQCKHTTDGFHLVIDALKLNDLDTIFALPGIPITDLTAHGAGRGHAGHLVPPRAARRQRRRRRRLPDAEARHLPHGVGARLPERPDRAGERHDQLLPDDPDQSGSSEREIVDLQQGDYEEMDQLAIAKPLCKAAFRVLHAEDIGVGIARAIRSAVSGRPGGVYLDLPAKLFAQTMDAEAGRKSLIKVVDPAPRQIPVARRGASARSTCSRARRRPLILLGKGAAYARADADIRAFVEKTGIPYLPMSMAKGLLPDNHPQSASAARSYVLAEADVVMLVGARLNWLLSHGKGKTWGGGGAKDAGEPAVHPDRHLADRGRQQRGHRRAGDRRHRLLRIGACLQAWAPAGPSRRPTGPAPSPSARTRT